MRDTLQLIAFRGRAVPLLRAVDAPGGQTSLPLSRKYAKASGYAMVP
jgi:hypothetical protein